MNASPRELRTAIRLLETFKRIDPDITLPAMLTLLYAAERDGQSGNQYAITERLGMSGATASRSLSHWMDRKRTTIDGLGLDMLESIPDPEDRRYRVVTLNSRGIDFIQKLTAAITNAGENA